MSVPKASLEATMLGIKCYFLSLGK